MIGRGQIFVRALNRDGKWRSADALDLDDDSFRRFILNLMHEQRPPVALVTTGQKAEPYRLKPELDTEVHDA